MLAVKGYRASMAEQIVISGVQINVRRNGRARRMTLRVPRAGGGVVLTVPPRASLAQAEQFARDKADWLQRTLRAMPALQRAEDGAYLPVGGRGTRIRAGTDRSVWLEDDVLHVPQNRPVWASVQVLLKQRAGMALRDAVDRYALAVGRQPKAMVLRDTKSRWGSCTPDGRLMFSWRLAMAPPKVLDYVAAHEVAHLVHMDHSPRFWAKVKEIMPDYDMHRLWLRQNGSDLQSWRFKPD